MKSKVWTILLSAFVAFGLWTYVVTVEHTQIEMTFYNIPVNWAGEEVMNDRDLQLVDRNMTISMKLYGNRSVLNKMKSSDIIVLADLSHITEAGEKHLDYTVNYSGVANNSIDVVDKPASINVQVAQWKELSVKVDVVIEGEDALKDTGINGIKYVVNGNGYAQNVNVSGPVEAVNRVAYGRVFVNMAGKDATVAEQMTVTLFDAEGNQIVDDRIYKENALVTVPVAAEREIALNIDIIENDTLLTGSNVKVTLSQQTVKIRGTLDAVRQQPAEKMLGSISLKDVTEGFKDRVYNISFGEGISCDVASVKATLEVPELKRAQIKVNSGDIIIPELLSNKYQLDGISNIDLEILCLSGDASKFKDVKIRLKAENVVVGTTKISYEIRAKDGSLIACPFRASQELAVNAVVTGRPSAVDLI